MGLLGQATSREVAESGPAAVLVPIGSCEQHGPHLPLTTDTTIAMALCSAAAAEIDRCVVAPAIAIGASGEHHGFAGTLSIGTETLSLVLIELVRSTDWASRVVFVNGHGGNVEAVRHAVETLRSEGRRSSAWSPSLPDDPRADAHAGWLETSVMLHLEPQSVRLDRIVRGDTRPLADTLPLMRTSGVAAVSINGVLGDPTQADADDGARLFHAWTEDLVNELRSILEADR